MSTRLRKTIGKRSRRHRISLESLLRQLLRKHEKYLAVEWDGDISFSTAVAMNGLRIARRKDGTRLVLIPLELLQGVPPLLNIDGARVLNKKKVRRRGSRK